MNTSRLKATYKDSTEAIEAFHSEYLYRFNVISSYFVLHSSTKQCNEALKIRLSEKMNTKKSTETINFSKRGVQKVKVVHFWRSTFEFETMAPQIANFESASSFQ